MVKNCPIVFLIVVLQSSPSPEAFSIEQILSSEFFFLFRLAACLLGQQHHCFIHIAIKAIVLVWGTVTGSLVISGTGFKWNQILFFMVVLF